VSLDLTKIAAQVGIMIAGLKDGRAERERRLRFALETANNQPMDLAALQKKIKAGKTTWLVAELTEALNRSYPLPPAPADFTVMATDGSHIDVDRHRTARCFLINIGAVSLTYGSESNAELSSSPRLFSDEKDLVIAHPGGGREQMIEGNLLGAKRSIEELKQLADLAAGLKKNTSALALLDGTLILWGLEAYPEFVGDALLASGLLPCLDTMKKLNTDRRLALASYISFPRSTDVVNVLRVAVCPNDVPDCDDQCPPGKERDCDGMAGVRDRDLFMDLLGNGERSALFISPSKVVKEHYGEHRIYFFYLKGCDEIARVEIPEWVAESEPLLDLTHALVYDQCQRGGGYPVALSESHEQAVVTGADREYFWELVESSMIEGHLPYPVSAKSFSKRTRWV
jgi:hypothetical protein